jgi:hypothetical protein
MQKKRYQFSNFQDGMDGKEDENIYSPNNQFANAINEGNKC